MKKNIMLLSLIIVTSIIIGCGNNSDSNVEFENITVPESKENIEDTISEPNENLDEELNLKDESIDYPVLYNESSTNITYHKSSFMIDEKQDYYIISSADDYDMLYEFMSQRSFDNLNSSYDEEFFSNNTIIIIPLIVGSGSTEVSVQNIDVQENSAVINVTRQLLGTGTCDMMSYLIEIVIPNNQINNAIINLN